MVLHNCHLLRFEPLCYLMSRGQTDAEKRMCRFRLLYFLIVAPFNLGQCDLKIMVLIRKCQKNPLWIYSKTNIFSSPFTCGIFILMYQRPIFFSPLPAWCHWLIDGQCAPALSCWVVLLLFMIHLVLHLMKVTRPRCHASFSFLFFSFFEYISHFWPWVSAGVFPLSLTVVPMVDYRLHIQ